jgi:hypothetical protein
MTFTRPDFDKYITDIVETANAARPEKFSCKRIKRLPAGSAAKGVQDSPGIYFVPGALAKDDAVLKISNENFPDLVELEVEKTRLARRVLSNDLAGVIPIPIFDGRFMGRSFVFLPKYRCMSDGKIIHALQKRLLYDNLFTWLRGVAEVSIDRNPSASSADKRWRLPLEYVREHRKQSSKIRSIADLALELLDKGRWRPVSVLQHSDFWLGNILLPSLSQRSSSNRFKFFVIDWGGSIVDGGPGFDMVRLCMSSRISLQRARGELLNYCRSINIDHDTLVFEVIAGLGRIGKNLNQFPEERYMTLCENTLDYLRAVGINRGA